MLEAGDDRLRVGLKHNGWHRNGTLELVDGDLVAVPRSLFTDSPSAEIRVPQTVVVVRPIIAIPWCSVSLQLGGGSAAIVPFRKRAKLMSMIERSGRSASNRRTLLRLSVRPQLPIRA